MRKKVRVLISRKMHKNEYNFLILEYKILAKYEALINATTPKRFSLMYEIFTFLYKLDVVR